MLEKIKYRLKILRALRPFASGVKKFLLVNLITGFLVMVLGFIQPVFYKLFIEDVILQQKFDMLPVVIAGYLSVFALDTMLGYLKIYSTNRLVNRVSFRARMKILRGFFLQDFNSYDRQSIGDMKMRLDDDTGCIASYAGMQTVDYLISYITLIAAAGLLFFIEWRLALFSCIAIPLTFRLDHIVAKREAVVQDKQRENDQKMASWLHASVQGWREIKALNLQRHEERQFTRYIHKFAIFFGTWINYWVVRVLVAPKIKDEFLMQFSLYFLGGLMIISGQFEIGLLLVFMQYYGILANAVKMVSGTDAELLSAKPRSDRMLEELSKPIRKENKRLVLPAKTKIEFQNVTFTYPGFETETIHNLNFIIYGGERVAITGKSGTGKTTAVKLIMGMLSPVKGRVLFSDIDIRDISIEAMHHRIGLVMQENMLFNASIKENLLYGKENATDEEMAAACKKAFILDFIRTLPDGMDTIIGERGIKLSGGQKQRIVLARLFLRDVDVLIFDEATSALDQYSERLVYDAVKNTGKDKTIIVIAHRQSSLSLCDRVITL